MNHHLYRHFDKDNTLLYVGTSLSALARLQQHKSASPWFAEIAVVQVESFRAREEAITAERAAIEKERPKYNTKWVAREYRHLISALHTNKAIARAGGQLAQHVALKLLYDVKEVARMISVSTGQIERWMNDDLLGYVLIDKRPNSQGIVNQKRMVTGWHLIDFTEYLMQVAAGRKRP